MLQFLTPKLIQNWTWKMFYFDFSQWHNLNTGGSSGPAVGELRLNVVAMEFWTKGSGLRTSLYPITAIKSELKTHISNMYHHIVSVDMKLQHDPRLCSCTYMCMSTHIRTHTRLTGSIACTCNRHNFKAEQGQGFSSVRKPRVLTSRTSLSYIMKTICELSPAKKKKRKEATSRNIWSCRVRQQTHRRLLIFHSGWENHQRRFEFMCQRFRKMRHHVTQSAWCQGFRRVPESGWKHTD